MERALVTWQQLKILEYLELLSRDGRVLVRPILRVVVKIARITGVFYFWNVRWLKRKQKEF
jgi:hypothetical protein